MKTWNQLVVDSAAIVLGAALHVTGLQADAEDVAQEVFCEAIQIFSSLNVRRLGNSIQDGYDTHVVQLPIHILDGGIR